MVQFLPSPGLDRGKGTLLVVSHHFLISHPLTSQVARRCAENTNSFTRVHGEVATCWQLFPMQASDLLEDVYILHFHSHILLTFVFVCLSITLMPLSLAGGFPACFAHTLVTGILLSEGQFHILIICWFLDPTEKEHRLSSISISPKSSVFPSPREVFPLWFFC